MKNLQVLLLKFPREPGQEIGYNVSTQTDCTAGYIELKVADSIIHEPPPVVSYVLDHQTWDEVKELDSNSFVHSARDIIVSCDAESLAAITGHSSAPPEATQFAVATIGTV